MKYEEVNKKLVIKKRELLKQGSSCFFCLKPGDSKSLTLAHLIRRSYSKEFILDDRNLVLACMSCHTIYDDGYGLKLKFLHNLDKALLRVKEMDELYYNRVIDRSNR